jgi:hypothetical protein
MFWTASVVCLSASFILSWSPIGVETSHYLVGIVYAAAAILPLLARSSVMARAVVVAGMLVFLLNSVIALDHSAFVKAPPAQGPSPQVAEDVARTAERMHATLGYAPYWDAATITWRANFRVLVAPIVGCEQSSGGLCPGPHNYIEEWYRAGTLRTFLLTDSSGPTRTWTPPARLGRAIATYRFGTVTMYVYGYDIATSLVAS